MQLHNTNDRPIFYRGLDLVGFGFGVGGGEFSEKMAGLSLQTSVLYRKPWHAKQADTYWLNTTSTHASTLVSQINAAAGGKNSRGLKI